MSTPQPAAWHHVGRFCRKCEQEITDGDQVVVDEDGEPDEYGGWRDLTTIAHAGACPPEE